MTNLLFELVRININSRNKQGNKCEIISMMLCGLMIHILFNIKYVKPNEQSYLLQLFKVNVPKFFLWIPNEADRIQSCDTVFINLGSTTILQKQPIFDTEIIRQTKQSSFVSYIICMINVIFRSCYIHFF